MNGEAKESMGWSDMGREIDIVFGESVSEDSVRRIKAFISLELQRIREHERIDERINTLQRWGGR